MTTPLHGQYPRPWMTDLNDPRDADVFLVGQNQARGYPVSLVGSHKRHVDALLNRNEETCRGLYDELNPEPSPTRRNIDRMAAYLRREGLRTLETNVVCFSSPMSADLTAVERARGADIFKWLLRRTSPRVIIIHGSGAAKDFARIYRGCAKVIEIPSLAPPAYNRWQAQSDTLMERAARQAAVACRK